MGWLSNEILDGGLDVLDTSGTRLDVCSAEPSSYAEATSTYTLGYKVGITISSPTDGDIGGRKVTISEITDGTVTGSGSATHWAITNNSNTIYATGALDAPTSLTSGRTLTVTEFTITIPDPS